MAAHIARCARPESDFFTMVGLGSVARSIPGMNRRLSTGDPIALIARAQSVDAAGCAKTYPL